MVHDYTEGGFMQTRIWTILLCVITIAVLTPGVRGQTNVGRQPIARIGDQLLYPEDLLPSIAGQLFQLKNQEYELQSKELEKIVNERLLESAAKRNGLSTDVFLEQKVYRKLPVPTTNEVEAFYLGQKNQINRPFNEVKPQMQEALSEARRQQAREEYLDKLRGESNITILLPHSRIDVAVDPSRLRGDPGAPVTIVEFSDFQCPFCRAAQQTVREVVNKYRGRVRLSYRDFPLRQVHPLAQQAAEAARCAGEQNKFWEYHDLLFSGQSKLDQAGLIESARTVRLDLNRFSECLASSKFKAAVDSDFQAGLKAGLSGTPAFYIDGILLSGVQPLSAFEKLIDAELAAAESKNLDKSESRSEDVFFGRN
jgi:predicted DsbA family dithiol-disulfide isomerase